MVFIMLTHFPSNTFCILYHTSFFKRDTGNIQAGELIGCILGGQFLVNHLPL